MERFQHPSSPVVHRAERRREWPRGRCAVSDAWKRRACAGVVVVVRKVAHGWPSVRRL
ncbi:hypothetical protein V6Z11_A10G196300 [Gossypium hirsutum]